MIDTSEHIIKEYSRNDQTSTEILVFGKPGTICQQLNYKRFGGLLVTSGDFGDSIHGFTGGRWTLKQMANTNFDYFSSKLRAAPPDQCEAGKWQRWNIDKFWNDLKEQLVEYSTWEEPAIFDPQAVYEKIRSHFLITCYQEWNEAIYDLVDICRELQELEDEDFHAISGFEPSGWHLIQHDCLKKATMLI